MSKFDGHTKGPWTIESFTGCSPYLISGDKQTKIICTFSHERLTKKEKFDNAPLLRAAPDLLTFSLEALVQLKESCNDCPVNTGNAIGGCDGCQRKALIERGKKLLGVE